MAPAGDDPATGTQAQLDLVHLWTLLLRRLSDRPAR
jgi:hypothetical protein